MIVCRGRLSGRNEAAIISLAIVRTDRSSWSPPFPRRCHLLSLSLSLFSISLPTRCFVSRRCYEAANLLSVPSAKAVKLTHKTDRWTEILAWKGSTDRFAGLPCNRARADCSCSILDPFTSPRLEYDFASTRKPRCVHCQGYSRLVAPSILARFPPHFAPLRSLFNLTRQEILNLLWKFVFNRLTTNVRILFLVKNTIGAIRKCQAFVRNFGTFYIFDIPNKSYISFRNDRLIRNHNF